jgi:hypothetical protein
MKNINISKRDLNLVLILIGALILLLVYLLVYRSNVTKTATANSEATALHNNAETYREGIRTATTTIKGRQAGYVTDIRAEDWMMYAVGMQNTLEIMAGSLSFSQPSIYAEFTGLVQAEGGGDEFATMTAFSTGLNFSTTFTYSKMKEFVRYIYADRKATLDTISFSYSSETGELSATVSMTKRFLRSADDPYIPTKVPDDIPIGVENPFGTLEIDDDAAATGGT